MEPVRHHHRHRRPAAAVRRRHRPDHPLRVAQAGRAHRLRRRACSPSGGATPSSCSTAPSTPAPASSSPGRTSAPARPGSTRCGLCRTTASRPSCRPGFADIFRTNCTKAGVLPVQVDAEVGEALLAAVEADPAVEITIDVDARTARRPAAGVVVHVPARRLHPVAVPRGPRRHRPDPPPRGRHRHLRGARRRGCRAPVTPAGAVGGGCAGGSSGHDRRRERHPGPADHRRRPVRCATRSCGRARLRGDRYPGDDAGLHLGAFDGDRLVGIASLYREARADRPTRARWRLRGMATDPDVRGAGFGARAARRLRRPGGRRGRRRAVVQRPAGRRRVLPPGTASRSSATSSTSPASAPTSS